MAINSTPVETLSEINRKVGEEIYYPTNFMMSVATYSETHPEFPQMLLDFLAEARRSRLRIQNSQNSQPRTRRTS